MSWNSVCQYWYSACILSSILHAQNCVMYIRIARETNLSIFIGVLNFHRPWICTNEQRGLFLNATLALQAHFSSNPICLSTVHLVEPLWLTEVVICAKLQISFRSPWSCLCRGRAISCGECPILQADAEWDGKRVPALHLVSALVQARILSQSTCPQAKCGLYCFC